jgi:hypothetical protein
LTVEVFDGKLWSAISPSVPFTFYVSCMVYINSTTVLLIAGTQGSVKYGTKTFYMNSDTQMWIEGPPISGIYNIIKFTNALIVFKSYKRSMASVYLFFCIVSIRKLKIF